MSIILITGSNSGIGKETALYLARKGHHVYASMRDLGRGGELQQESEDLPIELCQADVNDEASIKACVRSILDREGQIDVLINNAGIGPMGPIEEMDDAASKAVFETNLFGALRATRAVLPSMRKRKSGQIVNVSSVAGRVASAGMGIYAASKFALEAVSEALAQEVAPFGIKVALIEPGFISTPILGHAHDSVLEDADYPFITSRIRALFSMAQEVADSPQMVAETIEKAINDESPMLRYTVGEGARKFTEGRARMSDEEWIAMGRHENVEAYFEEFGRRFS